MRIAPPLFVAEVKTTSPFGFESPHSFDHLLKLAIRFGDMISIHTNPRWGGHMGLIGQARDMTDKPILAKGIHATDTEIQAALRHGADRVLVVGRLPTDRFLDKIWYEPVNVFQLATAPKGTKVVWNARNLVDGAMKAITTRDAFDERKRVSENEWFCQASMIKSPEDVLPGVDAFIVGENLPAFTSRMW